MKKRLRKKLRLREFQEMAFTLDFDVHLSGEADESERECREYTKLLAGLETLLKKLNLKTDFRYCTSAVVAAPYKSVTVADRQAIIDWMQQQPEVAWLRFGPLTDYNWRRTKWTW